MIVQHNFSRYIYTLGATVFRPLLLQLVSFTLKFFIFVDRVSLAGK
jgi:hypothetical protein